MTTRPLEICWTTANGELHRQLVPSGGVVRLGRAPHNEVQIAADMAVSRDHAQIWIHEGHLALRCLETARHPVVVRGQLLREALLPPGERFQIGNTAFQVTLLDSQGPRATPSLTFQDDQRSVVNEQVFDDVRSHAFFNAEQQIEILSRLPRYIATSPSDEELGVCVARLLLEGIPPADVAAVVVYDSAHLREPGAPEGELPEPKLLRFEPRKGFTSRFQPSRRLMLKALRTGLSVRHLFGEQTADMSASMSGAAFDWAVVTPVRGEATLGWCLYVAGCGGRKNPLFPEEDEMRGDLRFMELLAEFIASVRQVRVLQSQRTQLSAFFSPKVVANITAVGGASSLQPAERDITVLFCDLHGFSRQCELLQDELQTLLRSVSTALGAMADGVLEHEGAIADFQGDALLGFWGWPVAPDDGPIPACRAALAIQAAFRAAGATSLLSVFSVGIGIAHGRAIAGKIGTERQAKVGVFGPVVNQGSRLEGLTRRFDVGICVDEATADFVRSKMKPDVARVQRLGRVRPAGMETPLNVYALLPGKSAYEETVWLNENGVITNVDLIADQEEVAAAIEAGNWAEARGLLEHLPSRGPAHFYRKLLAADGPPPDWDGTIRLDSK